jgi:hypothetical protein
LGAWVGATLVGGALAAVVSLPLARPLYELVRLHATSLAGLNGGYLAVRIGITLVAAVCAAGPVAVVLGRRLRRIEARWLTASVIAALVYLLPVAAILAGPIGHLSGPPALSSLVLLSFGYSLITGSAFGLAQAIVLGRYVRRAVWWIAATILAHVLAGVSTAALNWNLAGGGMRLTTPTDLYTVTIAGAVLGSLIIGLVTGLVLARLLADSSHDRTASGDPAGPLLIL